MSNPIGRLHMSIKKYFWYFFVWFFFALHFKVSGQRELYFFIIHFLSKVPAPNICEAQNTLDVIYLPGDFAFIKSKSRSTLSLIQHRTARRGSSQY